MLEHLPEDILLKVFELLSTKEIARQACICHSWKDTVMNNMVSITLYPEPDRLAEQCAWLAKVADTRPQMLQKLQMETGALHDLGVLPEPIQLGRFTNLRRLTLAYLAGSERQLQTVSGFTLTASTVENLASLIYLEDLVIKYKPLENSATWRLPKNDISFSEFSAFTRMQHLEVRLVGYNLHLDMSPQLEGLKQLKRFGVEGLMSLEINGTMRAIADRLQVFILGVVHLPNQVLVMSQLTGLEFKLCGTEAQAFDMHRLPFHLLKLQKLSFEGAAGAVHELVQQLSTLPDLTKLNLEQNVYSFQCMLNSEAVRHFSCLENLKELRIDYFTTTFREPSVLNPFTCLRSLETLTIMDLESHLGVLLAENEALQKLRSLHIVVSRYGSKFYDLDVDMRRLPVLRDLEAHVHSFVQALHSSSLEVLRLDLLSVQSMTEAAPATPALLGNLQRLHTLHVHVFLRNLEEIWALAKEIIALDNLKQVILRNARDSTISSEMINPMLAAFSHVQHISSLELHDEWKSVILYNAKLPLVQHLRISCYRLEFTPSFAVYLERSFQYQVQSVYERPSDMQAEVWNFTELFLASDDEEDQQQAANVTKPEPVLPVQVSRCTGVTCCRK